MERMKLILAVIIVLIVVSCKAQNTDQSEYIFPDSRMGHFAKSWYETINTGNKQLLKEHTSDPEWSDFFETLMALSNKVGGINPVIIAYETEDYISIYSKENSGSWVKVNLGLSADNVITAMGIRKTVEPIDYDMRLALNTQQSRQIVKTVADEINRGYVVEKYRSKYSGELLKRMNLGEYDDITQGDLLADELTTDLREISNDKHLEVIPPSRINEVQKRFGISDEGTISGNMSNSHRDISGDVEVENVKSINSKKLDNNIGYISLERFVYNAGVVERTRSIFNELKECKAVIVDLRYSGGGDGEAVYDLLSYFFENRESITENPESSIEEVTSPNALSDKFSKKPLYVLTSAMTISAGEAFAYFLKQKKRATIIGVQTAGAGYLVDAFEIAHGFYLVNSIASRYDAEKGEGWEGKGITPDIEIPTKDALNKALSLIK